MDPLIGYNQLENKLCFQLISNWPKGTTLVNYEDNSDNKSFPTTQALSRSSVTRKSDGISKKGETSWVDSVVTRRHILEDVASDVGYNKWGALQNAEIRNEGCISEDGNACTQTAKKEMVWGMRSWGGWHDYSSSLPGHEWTAQKLLKKASICTLFPHGLLDAQGNLASWWTMPSSTKQQRTWHQFTNTLRI